MWTYIASWFAPTYLFLLLNLVVATIFIISRFQHHDHYSTAAHPPPLTRAPSLLDRVRSIDFSSYKFEQPEPGPNQLDRAPSLLERVKSIEFPSFFRSDPIYQDPNVIPDGPPPLSRAPSLLERVKSIDFSSFYKPDPTNQEPELSTPETDIHNNRLIQDQNNHVDKSKSEKRIAKDSKMKKSASEKSKMAMLGDKEEDRDSIEKRRPSTMKIDKTLMFEDKGVDEKADDFITKFKEHLRLQRLDSLLRHKEMLQGK